MSKRLLFGFFLIAIGISFIISKLTYENETYAYLTDTKNIVRIYYLDQTNDELVLSSEVATFQILNQNNEVVTSFETYIGNEYIEITILPIGAYTIRQIIASPNYDVYLDETFYIDNQNPLNIYLMANPSTNSKLAIALTDIKNNKLLDNAEFHILKENELLGTCTTIKGYCYINNLEEGTYNVENVIPATGYVSLPKKEFIIKDKITYLNLNAEPTRLLIDTYYQDLLTVTDGHYQIYDLMGNLIYNLEDLKYIEGLPIGSYYIAETRTPTGYKKIKDKIRFDIKDTTSEQKVHIYYSKITSNDDFINTFAILGIIFTGIGIFYLVIYYFYYKNNKLEHINNGEKNAAKKL